RLWLACFVASGVEQLARATNAAAESNRDLEAGRTFWSSQPVRKPSPPKVKKSSWPRDAVDSFILGKLEEKQLSPTKEASRQTLIRRVTFDLTGLPPAPDAIENFLSDKSPDAFEKVVERLLA